MGKVLCFVYESMADFETTFACYMLARHGEKEIINIGYENKPVKAASKIHYMTDMTVAEAINLEDVEALIIPGGFERVCKEELKMLIQQLYNNKKLICAICAGPEFLARAGILENHSYTTTLDENEFKKLGVEDPFPRKNYLEEKVVIHENIITAKGYSFIDFGIAIMDHFNIFEDAAEKESFAKTCKGE
jgi:putative intracellular protease/amidase